MCPLVSACRCVLQLHGSVFGVCCMCGGMGSCTGVQYAGMDGSDRFLSSGLMFKKQHNPGVSGVSLHLQGQ
jgi:hypothetical protein